MLGYMLALGSDRQVHDQEFGGKFHANAVAKGGLPQRHGCLPHTHDLGKFCSNTLGTTLGLVPSSTPDAEGVPRIATWAWTNHRLALESGYLLRGK